VSTNLEIADQRCVVRLEGEIDINCSEELKSTLVEALSQRRELQVDMTRASDLDITVIQLLWAAVRAAAKSGIPFVVCDGVPERIRRMALDGGFEGFPGSLAANSRTN
jgi:anti-anti-sigma factor